jgi:hypothetical protein
MTMTRTLAEPLTIAYIAMGAGDALQRSYGRATGPDLDAFEGEMCFIEHVIRHARVLDEMADPYDLTGVFNYEVAQPFGEGVANMMLKDGLGVTPESIRALMVELLVACGAEGLV